MAFLTLSFLIRAVRQRFVTPFKEWVRYSVPEPHSPKEGDKHYAHSDSAYQGSQNQKLNNEQQNKADDHSVHFLSGFHNHFICSHNRLPFFAGIITSPLSFASNSLLQS